MEIFKDVDGNELHEGVMVELTTNERVGERVSYYKRERRIFGINEDVTLVYRVCLGIFKSIHHGEIYTWYLETDHNITYNTSFWEGIGRTKAEQFANKSRPHTTNLSKVLSVGLAAKCKKVSNTKTQYFLP